MIESDIRKMLVEQLVHNQTLSSYSTENGQQLEISGGVKIEDVAEALESRGVVLLNDELSEQYRKARLGMHCFTYLNVEEVINKYARVIRTLCLEVCFEVDEVRLFNRDFCSELKSKMDASLKVDIADYLGQ